MRIPRFKDFSTGYSFDRLRNALMEIEEIHQDIKESMTSTKINNEERIHRIIKGLFSMMAYVLSIPFNQIKFQIKGYEMIGDLLYHFKSYKLALMYYMQGVFCIRIVEIVC